MGNTVKKYSRPVTHVMAAAVIICAMALRLNIVASAAVSATDITSYLKANGETYAGLSADEKTGYAKARKAVMESTQYPDFYSMEEVYGSYLYMYDHPAAANNSYPVTKAQASSTLKKANSLVSKCTGSTMFEQALSLHDLLCDTVKTYGCEGGQWIGQSAYEALVHGVTVCNGYASAYKLLCDLKGIPCHIVYGMGTNSSGRAPHAWNVVQLDDGKWYEVDVTWNDLTGTHEFFGLTTGEFKKHVTSYDGTMTMHERVPDATDPRTSLAPVAYGTKYKYVRVSEIKINAPPSVKVGETVKLTAYVNPTNAMDKNPWSQPMSATASPGVTIDTNVSKRFEMGFILL